MNIKPLLQLIKLRSEAGVTGVEYALLGALFAVASLGAIAAVDTAVTHELDDMTAGISASATLWDTSDDGSGGGDGTTTTTTSTTTTTTTTTTIPPTSTTTTSTTTTTIPTPVITADEGLFEWRNESQGKWKASAIFHNTWGEDVELTIEIVTTKVNGNEPTTVTTLEIGPPSEGGPQGTGIISVNKGNQAVSVQFRVISVTTKPENGEGVTYATTEPVVFVSVPG